MLFWQSHCWASTDVSFLSPTTRCNSMPYMKVPEQTVLLRSVFLSTWLTGSIWILRGGATTCLCSLPESLLYWSAQSSGFSEPQWKDCLELHIKSETSEPWPACWLWDTHEFTLSDVIPGLRAAGGTPLFQIFLVVQKIPPPPQSRQTIRVPSHFSSHSPTFSF